MGKLQTIICRLCLEICVDYRAVEDYVTDVLDILLLKINLTVSEEPVTCTNCTSKLMICFDFKATCFYAHDSIVPFLDDEKISKLDLRRVFMSNHKNVDIPDEHSVCGLCMGLAKKCTALYLDNEEMLKKLVEKYLPELDFSAIEEPRICAPCYESLKTCFRFVTSCLIVEEKIMDYRKLTGSDVIEIADVLQSASRNVSRVEDANTIDIISAEEKFCVYSGNADELLLNEEVEIKTDQSEFDRFQEHCIENKSPSEIKMFKCELCVYEPRRKSNLTQHLLTHKSPSETKRFKCKICTYKTNTKYALKMHLLTHKSPLEIEMFKCETCSYETKYKSNLGQHCLTHKSPSEIKMFKCALCPYEGKRKIQLQNHLLTHKNSFEIEMFKCALCSYESKQKSNLKRHLLMHSSTFRDKHV